MIDIFLWQKQTFQCQGIRKFKEKHPLQTSLQINFAIPAPIRLVISSIAS